MDIFKCIGNTKHNQLLNMFQSFNYQKVTVKTCKFD